jgi:hypothetical protein
MENETKICVDCNEEKELTEFYSQKIKKKNEIFVLLINHIVNHAQVKGHLNEIMKKEKNI